MHHEIQFGEGIDARRTWTDWGLFAMQQPTFTPPAVKRKIIDIPGGDGEFDLSEAISGYPTYANREGTWNFLIPEGSRYFLPLYNKMSEYLHGQHMKVWLPDDDPGWYYEGRVWVDSMASDRLHSVVAISYDVGPYKWKVNTSSEPWLWDPFSFVDGVIENGVYVDTSTTPPTTYTGSGAFNNIPISTTPLALAFYLNGESEPHSGIWPKSSVGAAPLQVSFKATAASTLTIKRNNVTVKTETLAANASTVIVSLVLYQGTWLYDGWPAAVSIATASGTGTLSMAFREGRL